MATNPVGPQTEEPTCFTNPPSSKPWVLGPADAEAVLASFEDEREPGDELKAAYRQYLEMVRQP
jgi:hypothetical protein